MTNEYETNEFDSEWQPGPTVVIDWWGGTFADEEYESLEDTSDLELE